ncbi:MAG: carboxyl transferase domain-containing protein [Actinomycetota bacterium]
MNPTTARDWLDLVLDPGWVEIDGDVVSADPLGFPGYSAQLARARAATGTTDSVLTASGAVDGKPILAISFEFAFLGGSMGVATGERVARVFERAADERTPVLALTASGGARMQEGMLALATMPGTLAARELLAAAHIPFIAYLRNPTTGGVFASFASSADLVWAQPGATIGFAGPRVSETVTGEPLPEGSHTAESALDAGLVDALVEPAEVRARLARALSALAPASTRKARLLGDLAPLNNSPTGGSGHPEPPAATAIGAWEHVVRARRADRPTGTDYAGIFEPLRRGGIDPTIVTGLATVGSECVVAIAQNRFAEHGRPTPAGYRRAREAIATAERLGLPIVTFVDTPGADPGAACERDGIAREISLTFSALLRATVPTVACVVGEGGSGGALALATCDRILIQENAIFSVIAPEGAASILRRDDIEAVARELRLTADDLAGLGLADAVVPEPAGGAHMDPAGARAQVQNAILWACIAAAEGPHPDPVRRTRWRAAGSPK